jgi:glycosyltransferase involved in cell wall biosynthesis
MRSFRHIYNPTLAPKVVACLRRRDVVPELWMFGADWGDGTLDQTRREVDLLKVRSTVHLCGALAKSQVPTGLQRGDIFLNTSSIDNTPVSVVEAMACGLCIVSTNIGGIPYLLKHEYDALLVPPDDENAMAESVLRLLSDPGLAHRLSRNARQKAEHFDWQYIFPQWREILSSLAIN